MNADGDETPEAAYRLLHERAVGQPPTPGERSLSAAQYDSARADYLAEKRIAAKPGVAIWPPTSQTLMKRLGNGSWSTAMTSLGLTTNSGRTRGTGSFSDDDYRFAVAEFLDAAADDDNRSVTSDSFAQYTAWAKARTAAGAKRPSGAAVRQHFGSWEVAKTAAQA
ncbi:hypothetical protein FV141_00385 [Dermacoccus abyssi]|uniref:Uncharacterized protein n=1 Tax=Dermacoccus abyssi TaxID=322596 RepID=A0ABX5Z690_9MICO|nr:hypothetical protein FV141_00385 [Dermacoccus abyssi]